MIIVGKAHARAGLVGNPSDGYFGKTISIILNRFTARVTLYESPELVIQMAQEDRSAFSSLDELMSDVRLNGYYGGVRLIKATIKRFGEYCAERGIALGQRNFTVSYASDIPRRVGLAGSSGIITATLRALMKFFRVRIPKVQQPSFVLSVETQELGISAGLQDRVVQTYGGAVFMDFERTLIQRHGHGRYVPLDPSKLPPLYVAYRTDLAEGSEVFHNDIRTRFDQGEPQVVAAMRRFAELAELARQAIVCGRPRALPALINENFDLRASIYQIGRENLRMVDVARRCGAAAKFAGSGGAIVGVYDSEATFRKLSSALGRINCQVFKPIITSERGNGT